MNDPSPQPEVIDVDLHPMLRIRRPLIDTKPLEVYANVMVAAIEDGHHGIDLDGNGRVGKTTACVRLAHTFGWRGGRRYVFYFLQMTEHDRATEAYFFNTWLQAGNQKVVRHGPGNVGLERIANHLCLSANRAQAEVIIAPVDEGQRLVDADYEHLISLDNLIEIRGKRLFVVFINQLDCRVQGKEGIWTPSPHVVGRFKSLSHEFPGLNGVADIQHALDQYDSVETWPAGSGITFTQHFAPRLYARGWRLGAHATQFVEAVTNLREHYSELEAQWTWPMKTFEGFVAYLITRVVNSGDFDGIFSSEQISIALERSGYFPLEFSRKGLKYVANSPGRAA